MSSSQPIPSSSRPLPPYVTTPSSQQALPPSSLFGQNCTSSEVISQPATLGYQSSPQVHSTSAMSPSSISSLPSTSLTVSAFPPHLSFLSFCVFSFSEFRASSSLLNLILVIASVSFLIFTDNIFFSQSVWFFIAMHRVCVNCPASFSTIISAAFISIIWRTGTPSALACSSYSTVSIRQHMFCNIAFVWGCTIFQPTILCFCFNTHSC